MWPFEKSKLDKFPDWLKKYHNKSFKPTSLTLDDRLFVVLDCETTGLGKADQIVTIGAVKCTLYDIHINNALDQKYPEFTSVGQSAEIHGELKETNLRDKEELLKELISYLDRHIIVGHNISFDIQMIDLLLKKTFNTSLKNSVLDTAKLAIRIDPVKYERSVGGRSGLHLDDLCKEHNIQIENRHTALGDAYLTAQLFQKLTSTLKRKGITTVKDLFN